MISASVKVLLPAPGEPVIPMMNDLPVWGKSCLIVSFGLGNLIFNVPDQAGGRTDIARADFFIWFP
ncbi:MAG: hypothetical protein MZV70_57710 [Desulfobacterales bacterium]|nr:hypothetical protein [Desulfobacterales bacterium]